MRLRIENQAMVARVAQEILALTVTHPLEVIVRRQERRLTTAQQASVHALLRDIARHAQANGIPATEESVKQQAKANQIDGVIWPGEWAAGFGSDAVWMAKGTMDLTSAECRDLIDQLGAFAAEHGVPLSLPETWSETA